MNAELFQKIENSCSSEFYVLDSRYDSSDDIGNIIIRSSKDPYKIHRDFDSLFKQEEKDYTGEVRGDRNHYFMVEPSNNSEDHSRYKLVLKDNHRGLAYRTHKFIFEYDLSEDQSDNIFTVAGMIEDNIDEFSEYSKDELVLFSIGLILLSEGLVDQQFEDLDVLSCRIDRGTFDNILDVAEEHLDLDISRSGGRDSAFNW